MRALPPRKSDARTTNRRQYQDDAPDTIVLRAPRNGCNGFVTDDLYFSIVGRQPLRHGYPMRAWIERTYRLSGVGNRLSAMPAGLTDDIESLKNFGTMVRAILICRCGLQTILELDRNVSGGSHPLQSGRNRSCPRRSARNPLVDAASPPRRERLSRRMPSCRIDARWKAS